MTRPPRDAVRREILDVAQGLFAATGFRATSLQAIADQVPCSKATLLYHFRSKTALLDELVSPLAGDLRTLVSDLDDVDGPRRLSWLLDSSVRLVVRHRDALAMLRGLEDAAEISDAVAEAQMHGDRALAAFLGERPTALQRARAHTFQEGVLGACLQMQDIADEDLAAALRDVGRRIFDLPTPEDAGGPTPSLSVRPDRR